MMRRRVLPPGWEPLVLLTVVGLVHWRVLEVGYFAADDFVILRGFYAREGGVNWGFLQSILTCGIKAEYFYRPATYLFIAAEYALWQGSAAGYFAGNLLVHGLTSIAVWGIAKEIGWGRGARMFAALAILLHPLHLEVFWGVVGAYDLLAGLFSAATLWVYLRWLRRGGILLASGVAAGYFLALFAKEATIALPAVLGITLLMAKRQGLERRGAEHVALFSVLTFLAAGFLLARQLCLGRVVGQYPGGPSPADPLALLRGIPKLLSFMIFPAPWPGTPGTSFSLWIPAAVGAALLITTLALAGRPRGTAWTGATMVLLALPVLAIVGILERPPALGRIFLLPTIGLALLAGHAFEAVRGKLRPALVTMLLGWLLVLAQYEGSHVHWATLTRRVLTQIETAAREEGVTRIAVVGLPSYMFGPDNWALPLAAARPFADVAESVRVAAAPRPDERGAASTRILVWNPQTETLEISR